MPVQANLRATRVAAAHVYVISADGRCKIGVARNTQKRRSSLQVGSGAELIVFGQVRVPTRLDALQIERAAHDTLGWARERGEWFCLDPRYALSVVRLLALGDARRASALSVTLRRMEALRTTANEALFPERFVRADRVRGHKARRLHLAHYRRALRLGLDRCDWDDVLDDPAACW
jgi:hypothetical protein